MAKVKLNSLLADLRGRFGSVLISSNGSGLFLRTLKTPVQPHTQAQSAHRQRFTSLVSSWNGISQTNRDLWTVYAARADNERLDWFGDGYFPNARAQFISLNLLRLLGGAAIAEAPPTSNRPDVLPAMDAGIYASGAVDDSFIDPVAAFPASVLFVHASVSLTPNPGRGTPRLPFFVLGLRATSAAWPWLIDDLLAAHYGVVGSTGRYWLRLVPVSVDYRTGTPLYLDAPVGEEIV